MCMFGFHGRQETIFTRMFFSSKNNSSKQPVEMQLELRRIGVL